MPTIKVLPAHIANKIAAGEVVDRPASVVKELVENAIDARADHITVIISKAGKELIQVIDNGVGMTAEDAELAFKRHATSKISRMGISNVSSPSDSGEKPCRALRRYRGWSLRPARGRGRWAACSPSTGGR